MNSIEFGLKMGHSTGVKNLLCTAVKLFIYCYHIMDQETPLTMIPFMFPTLSLEISARLIRHHKPT